MPETRPVWITREQRDLLDTLRWLPGLEIMDAWDAAPADTRGAAIKAVLAWQREYSHTHDVADAVLRALGMPDA